MRTPRPLCRIALAAGVGGAIFLATGDAPSFVRIPLTLTVALFAVVLPWLLSHRDF